LKALNTDAEIIAAVRGTVPLEKVLNAVGSMSSARNRRLAG
jgi:hypothetical protein